jgi:hypothetical protein
MWHALPWGIMARETCTEATTLAAVYGGDDAAVAGEEGDDAAGNG